MKKPLLLLLAFALASLFAQAQDYSCDSLLLYVKRPAEVSGFKFYLSFSTKTSDGNIITCIPTTSASLCGDWLYKIDPQTASVIDSVFVQSDKRYVDNTKELLLTEAPNGNGLILARLIYKDGIQSLLRISHIDNDLNVQPHSEAVKVVLADFIVDELLGILLEGDQIVLSYLMDKRTPVLMRVGLDGSFHEYRNYNNLFQFQFVKHGFALYNETPREYAIFDWDVCENDTCLVYHVFDSLLAPKETFVMNHHEFGFDIYPVGPWPSYISLTFRPIHILPLDDNTFVEAIQYKRLNLVRSGACLLKYDMTTHECVANAQFESWPIYLNPSKMGYPIGMVKSMDGNIYFAYRTNNNISGQGGQGRAWIGIAKVDSDLNILWQRYVLGGWSSSDVFVHYYCNADATADGFVVTGKALKTGETLNYFYYFVHDDGLVGTSEAEAFIRPYMFYPNPTQNELHLQYSPDVQPKQIELYDLQGRLVRSQSKNLESLNMAGLPAGTYTMRVMLEGGKVFSDKVVKE